MSQTDVSLFKRLFHGIGANAYGQAVVIIVQLVGVPILLRAWGAQLYGEWLILAAIPSYLSMVDLGFSLSAANDMTARVARADRDGTLRVFQSFAALVYLLISGGLVLSALLLAVLPVNRWMHIQTIDSSASRSVLWLLAAGVLIQLLDGVNHAGFRAHGEYAFHSFFNYTALLAQQAALWTAALLGLGPVWAAASMLFVRTLNTSLMSVLLFHRHKTLRPGLRYASSAPLRGLIQPALANIAMPLAQAVNLQGMVQVIGAILGPLAVVVFSTLRALTRFAFQIMLSISHAFEPEMAAAWGRGEKPELAKLYTSTLRLGVWLGIPVIAFLFVMGDWIVKVWTPGKVPMDTMLFVWLLLSALLGIIWYGGLNLLKAGNRHLRAAIWYVLSSLAAVLLAWLSLRGTSRFPVAGQALLVMDGLMTIYTFRAAATSIGLTPVHALRLMMDFRALVQEISSIFANVQMSREAR